MPKKIVHHKDKLDNLLAQFIYLHIEKVNSINAIKEYKKHIVVSKKKMNEIKQKMKVILKKANLKYHIDDNGNEIKILAGVGLSVKTSFDNL